MRHRSKLPHWPPKLPGLSRWVSWRIIPKTLLVLFTTAALTALVYLHLDYYQVDSNTEQFRVGLPAPRAMIAKTHLLWEDGAATELQRNDAASRVPMQFAYDPEAPSIMRERLDALVAHLRNPNQAAEGEQAAGSEKIPADVIVMARAIDESTWKRLQQSAHAILDALMLTRIEEDNSETAAIARIQEMARTREADPHNLRVLTAITQAAMQPTWIKDMELTARKQQEARTAIIPVARRLTAGEVVIREGDIISQRDLDQLKEKHLLVPAPLTRIVPLGFVMLLAVFALGIYLRNYVRAVYDRDLKLSLLLGLILAALWASMTLGGGDHEYLVGIIAIPAAAMAIAGLLGVPTAIVSTILLSITAGLAADMPFPLTLLAMSSSLAGMMVVSSIWPASRAFPAILSLIGVNLVLLVGLESVLPGSGFTRFWPQLGNLALIAAAGGFGATICAVGAIYILARPFGITTHYRLMELSNPNEPLLRKMMLEAPGSYHSSVMVANIAEAAADAIGVDALLTRVAALYHDIGKLRRPGFFVENQAPLGIENMHQSLSPKLSYLILISHVKDGVEIAREHRLPEEIIRIIREHHGTTLAAYFFHRAVSKAGGETVSEDEYRYPGPKPSTREAAVVMLSDSVQASVKAIKEPTPSRIENMVQDIIENRLADGQLEDCDLTLRDLRRLREVFIRILTGLYTYTRIEYPDIKGEGTRFRANLNSESSVPASEPASVAPGN